MIVRETSRDAGLSGTDQDNKKTFSQTRSWLVQTTSPAADPNLVWAAVGVSLGDRIGDLKLTKFRVRASDGVGMLWTVTAEYEPSVFEDEGENPEGQPGIPGKPSVWGGSSGVSKKARYQDIFDNVMTNSAGDPFEEGCLADTADDRLTLTEYYRSHTEWLAQSKQFTNTVNSNVWNGGAELTWKCQGCSKKLNIENTDGNTLVYWEITWEFAYDAETWLWRPWDIGFNETTNEDGEPQSFGTGEAAPGRRTIKGKDGKGVRNPVALNGGVAKAPGLAPDALAFHIYEEKDFSAFGEVYTPTP